MALAIGLTLEELECDPELGVVDFPVGVVGFSSLFLCPEGVLELEEPPLLGLEFFLHNLLFIYSVSFFLSSSSLPMWR